MIGPITERTAEVFAWPIGRAAVATEPPALLQSTRLGQGRIGPANRTLAARPGSLGELSTNLLRPVSQTRQKHEPQYRFHQGRLEPKAMHGLLERERVVLGAQGQSDPIDNPFRLALQESAKKVGRPGLLGPQCPSDRQGSLGQCPSLPDWRDRMQGGLPVFPTLVNALHSLLGRGGSRYEHRHESDRRLAEGRLEHPRQRPSGRFELGPRADQALQVAKGVAQSDRPLSASSGLCSRFPDGFRESAPAQVVSPGMSRYRTSPKVSLYPGILKRTRDKLGSVDLTGRVHRLLAIVSTIATRPSATNAAVFRAVTTADREGPNRQRQGCQ
jgi:hypothetical protein